MKNRWLTSTKCKDETETKEKDGRGKTVHPVGGERKGGGSLEKTEGKQKVETMLTFSTKKQLTKK